MSGALKRALIEWLGPVDQEIASELMVSTATVKAYVTRIFTKLALTNRTQVAILVHDAR